MKDTTRVLLLGAPCIGKTHFVCKLALAQQFYQYLPTPGVDVHGYYVDDTFIKIYDTGGAERNKSIIESYYKTPDIIALTFAFNQEDPWPYLATYINAIKQSNSKATLLLLGLENFSNPSKPKLVKQPDIENFMEAYEIEHFIQCNSAHLKDYDFFNEKLLQIHNLRQIRLPYIRHQNLFEAFWPKDHCLLKQIENVLLQSQQKSTPFRFFEFKRYERKRFIEQTLKKFANHNHSWQSIENIIHALDNYNKENEQCFQQLLEYLHDKLKYQVKTETTSYEPLTWCG